MKPVRRKIIGRREFVDFPELGLFNLEAKIDTGAFTSSIHCKMVKHFVKDNIEWVSFIPLDADHPLYEEQLVECPLYKINRVKNSFGQEEERFVIRTKIRFFGEEYETEISLADRSLMEFPLLLGRKVLSKKFIVDVSRLHYATKQITCIQKK